MFISNYCWYAADCNSHILVFYQKSWQFKIKFSKLSQGHQDTWKRIKFSRHISKIMWMQNLSWDCLSPDSASAAFPSRPSEEMSPREETQNLKFPIYFLPPTPPIQSNKILFYFYLCLLLQNWTMLFVNLCKCSKGPTPLQTYFVSKMYTISVKTRLLKIHKKNLGILNKNPEA